MASILALISKAVFEALPARRLGGVAALDRYTSKNPAFERLGPGDAIFLVTVRPGDALWLVAIIERPKRKGDALVGDINTAPIVDLTPRRPAIALADGKGIQAALGKLGMSLQTPRVLADADVALLRGAQGGTSHGAAPSKAVKMDLAPARKKQRAAADAPAVKLKSGKPSPKARALLEQVYKNPDDRGLRTVLADQLLEDHHVWGELISLQLTDPKRHRERIAQIIRQHASDIVGAITKVSAREDLEIVDGFLVACRAGKSKSFTNAPDRLKAAKAREWATVRTVTLTFEMPGTFVEALLHNPASANLTKILFDGMRTETLLSRDTPAQPWRIGSTYSDILGALPEAELARIPTPTQPGARTMLEEARAKRARKPKRKAR